MNHDVSEFESNWQDAGWEDEDIDDDFQQRLMAEIAKLTKK